MHEHFADTPLPLHLPSHTVVDVTLRDGGFRTKFNWPAPLACRVIDGAIGGGADWVEIGYASGVPELHGTANVGEFAKLSPDRVEAILKGVSDPQAFGHMAVMVHPSASAEPVDFDGLRQAGVGLVRFVYHESWADRLFDLHRQARRAGLTTAINIALASRYEAGELERLIHDRRFSEAAVLYLADTCGALTPAAVRTAVSNCKSAGTAIGFHAHDYLTLAISNCLAALEGDARWIDTSLWGIGRGAGNARAEVWMALRWRAGHRIPDASRVLDAMDAIEGQLGRPPVSGFAAVMAGAANLSPPQEDAWLRSLQPDRQALLMFDQPWRASA